MTRARWSRGARPPPRFAVAFSPVEPLCACGEVGCFGLGWPLATPERWYCPEHLPADYWTRRP